METVMFLVAYIISHSFSLALIYLAPMRVGPVQNMQDGAKLVANLIQTSLFIPFYKQQAFCT